MDVMTSFGHTIHSGKFIFFSSFCSWVHWKASYPVAFLSQWMKKALTLHVFFTQSVVLNKFATCIWYKTFLNLLLTSKMWAKYCKFKINKVRCVHIQIENESYFCKIWSPFLKLTINWVNGHIESQNILN